MKKSFYDIDEILNSSLKECVKPSFVNLCLNQYTKFLKECKDHADKYEKILNTPVLKHTLFWLKIPTYYQEANDDIVFNFLVGVFYDSKINTFKRDFYKKFNTSLISSNEPKKYFQQIIEKITQNNFECSISYLTLKKGFEVETHTDKPDTLIFHILLEDILDGEFKITVDKETKIFNKKGEWFIFDSRIPHAATMNGNFCKMFGVQFPLQYVN